MENLEKVGWVSGVVFAIVGLYIYTEGTIPNPYNFAVLSVGLGMIILTAIWPRIFQRRSPEPAIALPKPPIIKIFGRATTTGGGTHPESVNFKSEEGEPFIAIVSNGEYHIDLPNVHVYSVKIQWSGLMGARDACEAGTLELDQDPGKDRLRLDWSC